MKLGCICTLAAAFFSGCGHIQCGACTPTSSLSAVHVVVECCSSKLDIKKGDTVVGYLERMFPEEASSSSDKSTWTPDEQFRSWLRGQKRHVGVNIFYDALFNKTAEPIDTWISWIREARR